LAQLDQASRMKANQGLDHLSDAVSSLGPDFGFVGDALTDFAGTRINQLSETFKTMAEGGGADAALALAEFADSTMEGGKVNQETIKPWVLTNAANDNFMQNLINAGGPAKEFATNMLLARKATEEATAQEARLRERGGKDFQESVDKNVQELTGFEDMLQKVQASFEYKRMETFLDLMGGTGSEAVRLATEGLKALHEKIMAFNNDGQVGKFRAMVIDNPILAAGALVTAFGILKAASWATSAAMVKMGPSMMKLASGIGKLGAVGAAAAAGYAIGTGLNALPTLFGADSISTNIGDLIDRAKGVHPGGRNDPMAMANTAEGRMAALDPAQREVLKLARERQAAARQKETAAKTSEMVSTPQAVTPAEPSMSPADVAKLDQAAQTNYYLSELLKVNKKTGRALTGEM